jgi:hypothetical protein
VGPNKILLVLWTLRFMCPGSYPSVCRPAPPGSTTGQSSVAPKATVSEEPGCKTTQDKDRITIACDYTGATVKTAQAVPPIELDHAFLSFQTKEDNYMAVELVFTNRAKDRVANARDVYLEIDDDAGVNYMRRLLSIVDFRKLVPGEPTKFETHLLSAAFMPKHYVIYLWIPSSEPSLKFKPANNLLLSSTGVADAATGLNKVADFTVETVTSGARTAH